MSVPQTAEAGATLAREDATSRPIRETRLPDRAAAATQSPVRPLAFGRTFRFAARESWDALGFVCAASLTLFTVGAIPLVAAVSALRIRSGPREALALAGALALWLALVPPLYGGACWLVHRIVTRDDPSYLDLWSGCARLFARSLLLGAVQAIGCIVLAANLLFYASRPGPIFLALAVLFIYLLAFWLMNVLYHWPLLVACEAAILQRDDGRKPGLSAVLRNGLLLSVTAPGYSLLVVTALAFVAVPLVVSGVGMALLLPGFSAFLAMQACRDQLVRFGALPPPPDPDEPVQEDSWRVQ